MKCCCCCCWIKRKCVAHCEFTTHFFCPLNICFLSSVAPSRRRLQRRHRRRRRLHRCYRHWLTHSICSWTLFVRNFSIDHSTQQFQCKIFTEKKPRSQITILRESCGVRYLNGKVVKCKHDCILSIRTEFWSKDGFCLTL